ncbi:MAG: phage tail tape measure protein, partial [Synergistaceae bacterium]|nr:phage tail tape measure protein [Synergistaceae bacterium]
MSLNAGQVSIGLSLDDSEYSRALSRASGALDGFGASALRITAITGGIFASGAAAIARFGQEALRVGGAFEASMTRVAAITGVADKELAALTAKARELGATLPIMARDAADAMGVLATRGYD